MENRSELSQAETRLILLEAEVAKLNRRLELLRRQAEQMFQGAGKLTGVHASMGAETILEIKASLNLAALRPDTIHELADQFSAIVTEVSQLLSQKDKRDEELSKLRLTNKVQVRIQFDQ